MRISLVSFSVRVDDEELHAGVRAINRQIAEDFMPHWGLDGCLRLEGRSGTKPEREHPPELRGDAVIYLWDDADIAGALGYHDENNAGLPCGFVFTKVADAVGEPWTVTLSHETLELLGDANVNKLAAGTHPRDTKRWALFWYEMCDAVQSDKYEIDGVVVSNFVLPLYFTPGEQTGGRNDFLGYRTGDAPTLRSFGVNPGGYVGFLDPETGKPDTFSESQSDEGNEIARWRFAVKAELGLTRRSVRYREMQQRALHCKE